MEWKGYDHAVAQQQLLYLEKELDTLNPGALAVLRENGLDPLDAACPRFSQPDCSALCCLPRRARPNLNDQNMITLRLTFNCACWME